MQKSEVIKLFAMIAAAYPRDKTFQSADGPTIEAWGRMLGNMTYQQAEQALAAHVISSPFPPSIHELLKGTAKTLPGADEAWGQATAARRKYGWNGTKEAKAALPPEVWDTVRMLYGTWEDFCTSPLDEQTATRAHFLKLWEARERRESQLMLAGGTYGQITAG